MSEQRIQTPGVLAEDELDRSLRPRRLDEFVGQHAVKEQLAVSPPATAPSSSRGGPPESTASAIFGPTDCTPSRSRNRSRSSSVAKP